MDIRPEQNLTLHAEPHEPGFYWVGDYSIFIVRVNKGWVVHASICHQWLTRSGLDGVLFTTRREALQAIESALFVDPLSSDPIIPMRMLKPTKSGYELKLPDGRTCAVRREETGHWSADMGTYTIRAGTLWWMRTALYQRFEGCFD